MRKTHRCTLRAMARHPQDFIKILMVEDVHLVLFLTLVMVFRIPSQFMKVMLFPTPSFVSILPDVTSLNT